MDNSTICVRPLFFPLILVFDFLLIESQYRYLHRVTEMIQIVSRVIHIENCIEYRKLHNDYIGTVIDNRLKHDVT